MEKLRDLVILETMKNRLGGLMASAERGLAQIHDHVTAEHVFLVVHPRAKRKYSVRLEELKQLLRLSGRIPIESRRPDSREDLITITKEALAKGYSTIAPIGGDGTINACLQAFFDKGTNQFPQVALLTLPFGTGNDFSRGLYSHKDFTSWDWLGRGLRSVKVGVGMFKDAQFQERYFINSFSLGLPPKVVEHYETSRFRSYLYSTLRTLVSYRPELMKLSRMDTTQERSTLLFIISMGRFVGGGMRIHEESNQLTGETRCVWAPRPSLSETIKGLFKLYRSGLTSLPGIESFSFSNLTIQTQNEKNTVEADGEIFFTSESVSVELTLNCIQIILPD